MQKHPDIRLNSVFVIDDDLHLRQAICQWLELSGFKTRDFDRAYKAIDLLSAEFDGVVVSDVKMPEMDGLEFQGRMADIDRDIPLILITAHGDIAMAVNAIRAGAYDFIEKPLVPDLFLDVIRRALEKRALILENRLLKRNLAAAAGLDARLVGSSRAMLELKKEMLDIAPTDATIMLIGETGTGKEMVARGIHELSKRSAGPFYAVNCAAIPGQLADSELFGHERGAFTGADRQRIGRLEAARGGTLLLDEIGSMPLEVQGKLLRAIQEREIVPVGANIPRPVDFRIISATNEDPLNAVQQGKLREDLYYRINTVEIYVPPLRERKDDIPLLFELFLERAAELYDRDVELPTSQFYAELLKYAWPGNVRELKNTAERYALYGCNAGDRVLRSLCREEMHEMHPHTGLVEQVALFERQIIKGALKRHKGNMKAVLDDLGLPRRTLNEKMVRHGLSRMDGVDE